MSDKIRILVADDDELVRGIVAMTLQKGGYEVVSVDDGAQAVAEVQRQKPDLAVLDLNMPVMDGLETLRRIKALSPETEVLILTGQGDMDSFRQAVFESGAFDYLLKPCPQVELLQMVKNALFKRNWFKLGGVADQQLQMLEEMKKEYESKTRQLRESQIKFKEILDASEDLILILQDEKIRFANPRLTELTKLAPPALHQIPFTELIIAEDRAAVLLSYGKVLQGEALSRPIQFRVHRHDGRIFWVEASAKKTVWEKRPAVLTVVRDITDRKRNKELEAIVNKSPAVAFLWSNDEGWSVAYVSENIRQFGYEPEDFYSGRIRYSDVVHPADLQRVAAQVVNFTRQGLEEYSQDYRIVTAKGEIRWVDDRTWVRRDAQGQITYFQGLILDITDRKRAEEELRLTTQNLAVKLEELNFLFSVSEIMSNLKYSPEELCQAAADLLPKSCRRPEAASARIVLKNLECRTRNYAPSPWFQRAEIVLEEGPAGFVEVACPVESPEAPGGPFHKEEKALLNFVAARLASAVDRRRAQERLHTSEARYRMLVEKMHDGLIIVKIDFTIEYVNESLAKMLGLKREELPGRKVVEFFDEANLKILQQQQARRRRGEQTSYELGWVTPSGRRIFTIVSATGIFDPSGEYEGTFAVITDITEQKIMASQLVQAQKLEAIGQLAAGIAHEINTPTQFVGDNTRFLADGFTALLRTVEDFQAAAAEVPDQALAQALGERLADISQEQDLDYLKEEIPKAISQTLEGVERIASIVQSMKRFAHPGPDRPTPVDLNQAIESTVTVARNEWKYTCEMVLDLAPDLPLVSCRPGEFNQVILNILVNAVHAINEKVGDGSTGKGTITISTRRDGDWAEIRLGDTGPGIPEANRDNIFEPFFTTKPVGKGTGQGLAIAYDIVVNKHKGRITYETQAGEGTTFIIRLPLEPEPAADFGQDEPGQAA